MIQLDYYKTVVATQNKAEILKEELQDLIEEVEKELSNQVEAQVGKNLAEENKEGLTEWRTVLLNEKHHTLLKHILEMGIKDGWLGNEETKKLLRIITTAEKMDYYVGRKLTKAKLDKLTKFLQEQY